MQFSFQEPSSSVRKYSAISSGIMALLALLPAMTLAQNRTETIAFSGRTAPDGNGTFALLFGGLGPPRLNNSGQVGFYATFNGTSGGNSDDRGVFWGTGGAITQIARAGQSVPDGNGNFTDFSVPNLNSSGQVSFLASLNGTTGGTSDDRGVFLGSGGGLTQIAREGQAAPDGNGVFTDFIGTSPQINDSGQVAFHARLTGFGAPINENQGIFRGNGGALTQVARKGQAAPDGNGTFSQLSDPTINNAGQVAFLSFLEGTSGGSTDDEGIYRGTGGTLTQIARAGQAVPDGNGTFNVFQLPAINDFGQTAFKVFLAGTSGGLSDNNGIFTSDGIDTFQVIRAGDSLDGGTVAEIFFGSGLNNMGQITYGAELDNGDHIINLWTPDLHWRATGSSLWDTAARWTLGIRPDFVHDVFIDPATDLTVTGSASNRTVRSLQIGGGTGLAALSLTAGTELTATNGVNIQSTGILTGNGTIAGNVINQGMIHVAAGTHIDFANDMVQNGTMQIVTDSNGIGTAVVMGTFSGDGGFGGGGDLYALGQLSPGNSAASVLYDGNLYLEASTDTLIELGGRDIGEFDQLLVTGDLSLAGNLLVSLIEGHTLGFHQEYLIADVGGLLSGQFSGLAEGDLVGNFGGFDLFVSYTAGSGNGVSLFTAVPEPGAGILVFGAGFVSTRRRARSA